MTANQDFLTSLTHIDDNGKVLDYCLPKRYNETNAQRAKYRVTQRAKSFGLIPVTSRWYDGNSFHYRRVFKTRDGLTITAHVQRMRNY